MVNGRPRADQALRLVYITSLSAVLSAERVPSIPPPQQQRVPSSGSGPSQEPHRSPHRADGTHLATYTAEEAPRACGASWRHGAKRLVRSPDMVNAPLNLYGTPNGYRPQFHHVSHTITGRCNGNAGLRTACGVLAVAQSEAALGVLCSASSVREDGCCGDGVGAWGSE